MARVLDLDLGVQEGSTCIGDWPLSEGAEFREKIGQQEETSQLTKNTTTSRIFVQQASFEPVKVRPKPFFLTKTPIVFCIGHASPF